MDKLYQNLAKPAKAVHPTFCSLCQRRSQCRRAIIANPSPSTTATVRPPQLRIEHIIPPYLGRGCRQWLRMPANQTARQICFISRLFGSLAERTFLLQKLCRLTRLADGPPLGSMMPTHLPIGPARPAYV